MRWHLASENADARLVLAVVMARRMAPRGLALSFSPAPLSTTSAVASVLKEIGLAADLSPPAQNDEAVDTLIIIDAEPQSVSFVLPEAETVVHLPCAGIDGDDILALRALRERLREHLRHLFSRHLIRHPDPEAEEGWLRDPNRR